MPSRIPERLAKLANISRVTFACPYCGLESTYLQDALLREEAYCRSCKRGFLPFIFERDRLRCDICRKIPDAANYREAGSRTRLLCSECCRIFDLFIQYLGGAQEFWIDNFVRHLGKPKDKLARLAAKNAIRALLPKGAGS